MYFLEPNVLSLALLAGTSAIAHDVSFRQVARQQPLGLFAPLATSFRIGLIHAVRCGQRERLRRVVFCQSALVPGCVDCVEKGSDCQPLAPGLAAKWWMRASGGGQSWIVSRPVLSERRYKVRLSRLPALSIVSTSLVAGRRVRRISVGGLP